MQKKWRKNATTILRFQSVASLVSQMKKEEIPGHREKNRCLKKKHLRIVWSFGIVQEKKKAIGDSDRSQVLQKGTIKDQCQSGRQMRR